MAAREQLTHYGEFADEHERLTYVWLTPIIHEELKTYALETLNVYLIRTLNVYLKPLGKKKNPKSGMEYHDFVIVVDNDEKQ